MANKKEFKYRGGKSQQSRDRSAERAEPKPSKKFNGTNQHNGASISQSGNKARGMN